MAWGKAEDKSDSPTLDDDQFRGAREAEFDEDAIALAPTLASQEAVGGKKTISFFGGLALMTNNVTGPGLVALPLVFVDSGWLLSLLLLGVLLLASFTASLLLCDAIRALPGNADYSRRVELLSLAQELLPRWAYRLAFFTFILSFQMANIASIIESVKTADGLISDVFKNSCALEWAPKFVPKCEPFGDEWDLSLGFLVVALITVPLGYYNLDEAIWVQKGSFVFLGGIVLMWLISFSSSLTHEDSHSVAAVGKDTSGLIGTLLFNFMFVATIPSWLNEKKPGVSVKRTLWCSVLLGVAIFVLVGLGGAIAYGDGFSSKTDLLQLLIERGHIIGRLASYAFPPVALMSGIPVLSVCIRYNLVEQEVMSPRLALLFSVVLPWLLALILYRGNYLNTAFDWVSLFSAVPLNFLLPAWLYLLATSDGGPPHFSPTNDELYGSLISREDAGEPEGPAAGRAWHAGGGEEFYQSTEDFSNGNGGLALRQGFSLRAALEDFKRGDWLDTELGRKRAAARAVIAVAVLLNFIALVLKIPRGDSAE